MTLVPTTCCHDSKSKTPRYLPLNSQPPKLNPNGDVICLVTSGWAGVTLQKLQESLAGDCGVNLTGVIVLPKHYAEKEIPSKLIRTATPSSALSEGTDARCVLHEDGFAGLLSQMGSWEAVRESGKVHVVLEEGM